MTVTAKAGPIAVSGRPAHGAASMLAGLIIMAAIIAVLLLIISGHLTAWLLREVRRVLRRVFPGAGTPTPRTRPDAAISAQTQILRDLEAAGPDDSTTRVRLLSGMAARELATAAELRAAGDVEGANAAEWSAQLIRWIATAEGGVCPVPPHHFAYQQLSEAADARSLNDRAYACLRLQATAATDLGERATAVLASIARIYFRLAGHPPEEAARLAHGTTQGEL